MVNTLDIIASAPLFQDLPAKQLQEIKRIAVNRHFSKGASIFMEGDEGIGFFIVFSGAVKIFKLSGEGKEQILHIFGPGEPIGEVPVFTGTPFPAHAQAIEKSRLLFLPRKAFVDLIAQNPSLALNMLAILSKRLHHFTVQIENLALKDVAGRLASYLIFLWQEQEKPDQVRLNISKGQLASLLNTVPETLSRAFAKMTTQSLIEVNGANIKIHDPEGLKELSLLGRALS